MHTQFPPPAAGRCHTPRYNEVAKAFRLTPDAAEVMTVEGSHNLVSDADAATEGRDGIVDLAVSGEGPYRVTIAASGRSRDALAAILQIVPGAAADPDGGGYSIPASSASSLAAAVDAATQMGFRARRGLGRSEHRRRAGSFAAARCGDRPGLAISGDGPYLVRVSGQDADFFQLIADIKTVPGRAYDPSRRCWRIPASSRAELGAVLDKIEVAGTDVTVDSEDPADGEQLLDVRFPWATADLRPGQGRDWISVPMSSDDFIRRHRVMAAAPQLRWSPHKGCLYGLPPVTKTGWHQFRGALAGTGVAMTQRLRDYEPDLGRPHPAEPRLDRCEVPLRGFQIDGAAFALRYRRVLIADEPGLGKTFEALAAVAADRATPTVVVCPAAVRSNWRREAARMCPDAAVRVLAGSAQIAAAADDTDHWDITIVSYTALESALDVLPARPRAVILDEVQYVRNNETARSAAAARLVSSVPAEGLVIGLSGTPMPNRPRELEPFLTMTGLIGRFGGRDAYLEQFCRRRPRVEMDGLGAPARRRRRRDGIYDAAAHLPYLWASLNDGMMIRRRKNDVLEDLPDKHTRLVAVDLDPAMADLYRRCDLAVAESLAGKRIRLSALAAAGQPALFDLDDDNSREDIPLTRAVLDGVLAGGPAASSFHGVEDALAALDPAARVSFLRRLASVAKLPAVIDRIEQWLGSTDEDRKLVVFAHHRRVVRLVADRFDAGLIIGGMTDTRRDAVISEFCDSPHPRVLVCSIAAAGVGLNLQRASDVIFAEQPWNPSDCDQAEDRCHRIGQTRGVMVDYVVASDTIDEHVAATVERKRRVTGAAIDGGDWDSALADAVNGWMRSRRAAAAATDQPQLPGLPV